MKVLNKIAGLLGFRKLNETAEYLGLEKDAAYSLNSGRGSEYLTQAYVYLSKALEMIPEADRSLVFESRPKPQLTLSQKYLKKEELRKIIEEMKPRIQKSLNDSADSFHSYCRAIELYNEISKELENG